jgi:hypothetical protein
MMVCPLMPEMLILCPLDMPIPVKPQVGMMNCAASSKLHVALHMLIFAASSAQLETKEPLHALAQALMLGYEPPAASTHL